jgi:O-antigen/teichoic acid export membrane protein
MSNTKTTARNAGWYGLENVISSVVTMVLFGLFYLLRLLEPEDSDRFRILTGMLPQPVSRQVNKALSLLIRPDFAGATPTNI